MLINRFINANSMYLKRLAERIKMKSLITYHSLTTYTPISYQKSQSGQCGVR